MKFYLLAVCGVLCALLSMSHGIKTDEEIDREVKSLRCAPGEQPAKVVKFSSNGWLTKAECINGSLENSHEKSVPREEQVTTQAPSTVPELAYKTVPMECPFAHQPVNMSSFCPSDAKVTGKVPGCPLSNKVACVPEPFQNIRASPRFRGHKSKTGKSLKTEAELNSEMAHKSCIVEQRPTKILTWCRTDAKDNVDCGHTEIWCVHESSTTALKTVEDLEREISNIICPDNHRPILIRGMCPIGSNRSTDCEESRKACRPIPIGERHRFRKFNGWNRKYVPWDNGFRRGHGWHRWRGPHYT